MNRREVFVFGACAVAALAMPDMLVKAKATARVIKDYNFTDRAIVKFDEINNEFTMHIHPYCIIKEGDFYINDTGGLTMSYWNIYSDPVPNWTQEPPSEGGGTVTIEASEEGELHDFFSVKKGVDEQ